MEKLTTLSIPFLKVKLCIFYTGGEKLPYKMYKDGKLLFSGDTFRPSPLQGIDSLETAVDLLSFLTVKPGDTGDEYFSKYTPEQLDWCDSFECEQLGSLVSDLSDKDSEYYNESRAKVIFRVW